MALEGENGETDTLRAEDFRLALDPSGMKLKSAAFRIEERGDSWVFSEGRGFGHGVGLCQCGAEAMARRGPDAEAILMHYYPGSQIQELY
jgi:stage II sporulation protein D